MPGLSFEEIIDASAEYAARADSIEIPEFVKQRADPAAFTPDRFCETLAYSIYMRTGGHKRNITVVEYPVCKDNRAYMATAVFNGRGQSLSPKELKKHQRKWGIEIKMLPHDADAAIAECYLDLDKWVSKQ